jgi:hypothetical protein
MEAACDSDHEERARSKEREGGGKKKGEAMRVGRYETWWSY